MLIQSIHARNFMKYREISVENLPQKGTIGIIGDNEAGKTTLGECISFALFGKTIRSQEASLTSVIRWEADVCEVSLRFSVGGASHEVHREIDKRGNHEAALRQIDTGRPIARGVDEVEKALWELLKIDFRDFRYSYYLAQKELDIFRKGPTSARTTFIHRMLGLEKLEDAAEEVRTHLGRLRERKDRIESDVLVTKALHAEIKVDEGGGKRLSGEIDQIGRKRQAAAADIEGLERHLDQIGETMQLARELKQESLVVQRSFLYAYHDEHLKKARLELKKAGEKVKGSMDRSRQVVRTSQTQLDDAGRSLERLNKLRIGLDDLKNMISTYNARISKKITADTLSARRPGTMPTAISDNKLLQKSAAGRYLERLLRIDRWVLWTFAFLCASEFLLAFGWWYLTFVAPEKSPADGATFSGGRLGSYFLILALLMVGFSWSWRRFRRRIERARTLKNRIDQEVDELREESAVCLNFDTNDLGAVKRNVARIRDTKIRARFDDLQSEFGDLFRQSFEIAETQRQHQEKQERTRHDLETSKTRLDRLDAVIGRIERVLGEEIGAQAVDPGLDSAALEEEVFELTDCIARSQAGIEEIRRASGQPQSAPQVWSSFEKRFARMSALCPATNSLSLKDALQAIEVGYHKADSVQLDGALIQLRSEVERWLPSEVQLQGDQDRIRQELAAARARSGDLDREDVRLREEEKKHRQALERTRDLSEKIAALTRQLAPIEARIAVEEALADLLDGAGTAIKDRFGPTISRYIAHVLPKITRDRYRNIQITEDLEIRVFSEEKNDFVALPDLSGGTNDQLLISLRMAFAQALTMVRKSPDYQQFLFFDEPISSFDEIRSTSFLEMMRNFEGNFAQVFVISHLPLKDDAEIFTRTIRIDLHDQVLEVD